MILRPWLDSLKSSFAGSRSVLEFRVRSRRNFRRTSQRVDYAIQALEDRTLLAAPVLNPAGDPRLDPIPVNSDPAVILGTRVSDIINRMSPAGGISDADPGAQQGIAINGLGGTATGTWQYTVNGGTNWTNMAVTGNANALLLASDGNTRGPATFPMRGSAARRNLPLWPGTGPAAQTGGRRTWPAEE